MAFTNLGGSANLVADLSQNSQFQLTGLDANGKVLSVINVEIKDTIPTYSSGVKFYLPESSALNYRNVVININRGAFNNTLGVVPALNDKVNGSTTAYRLQVSQYASQQIQLVQGNNWTIIGTLLSA